MRRRHVVVLFQHFLFGKAIARALEIDSDIDVMTLPIASTTPDDLFAIAPDAIVLEDEPAMSDAKSRLLDAAPALTIVVGPEANTAEVYQRHEVIHATASEIIARITEVHGQPRARPAHDSPESKKGRPK